MSRNKNIYFELFMDQIRSVKLTELTKELTKYFLEKGTEKLNELTKRINKEE